MNEVNIPHMETIDNTAKLFGLPKHFVRQKVLSGEVIAVTAGSKYLVNVDKFAEYLNTNTLTAPVEQESNTGIIRIPVKL